jgi:hypothetical protein
MAFWYLPEAFEQGAKSPFCWARVWLGLAA